MSFIVAIEILKSFIYGSWAINNKKIKKCINHVDDINVVVNLILIWTIFNHKRPWKTLDFFISVWRSEYFQFGFLFEVNLRTSYRLVSRRLAFQTLQLQASRERVCNVRFLLHITKWFTIAIRDRCWSRNGIYCFRSFTG